MTGEEGSCRAIRERCFHALPQLWSTSIFGPSDPGCRLAGFCAVRHRSACCFSYFPNLPSPSYPSYTPSHPSSLSIPSFHTRSHPPPACCVSGSMKAFRCPQNCAPNSRGYVTLFKRYSCLFLHHFGIYWRAENNRT